MDRVLLESLKGKSREERKAYFEEHKAELLDAMLENVNGGLASGNGNPNSSVPDEFGNYWSSWGFVCNGDNFCG